MIPRTIHYCWFGPEPMPDLAKQCIASWHTYMPDYTYRLWNEETFDVSAHPYTREAYAAGYYAFVSDYVRLWAIEREGGIYLDVDMLVLRPMDALLTDIAFAGFEGSKHTPVMTGVLAGEVHARPIKDLLALYDGLSFRSADGKPDLTTNVKRLTAHMQQTGLQCNGAEQCWHGMRIYPVDYFCPRQTTGEFRLTDHTYADHMGMGSWCANKRNWKTLLLSLLPQRMRILTIQLKRTLFD